MYRRKTAASRSLVTPGVWKKTRSPPGSTATTVALVCARSSAKTHVVSKPAWPNRSIIAAPRTSFPTSPAAATRMPSFAMATPVLQTLPPVVSSGVSRTANPPGAGGCRRFIGDAMRSATINPKIAASMGKGRGARGEGSGARENTVDSWPLDRKIALVRLLLPLAACPLPLDLDVARRVEVERGHLTVVLTEGQAIEPKLVILGVGEPATRRLLLVGGDRAADLAGERVIACRDLLGDLHPRPGLQLVAEFNVHGGRVRGARGEGQGARERLLRFPRLWL